jgi:hypothetical protein
MQRVHTGRPQQPRGSAHRIASGVAQQNTKQ